MSSYLIKDTTKSERIQLIKSWVPEDSVYDDSEIDLWDMYADYINGTREIAEINASFNRGFYEESDMEQPGQKSVSCGMGTRRN